VGEIELACIFPAKQGSQVKSGQALEDIFIPVTRFSFTILFTLCRLICPKRQCHSEKSRSRVEERLADSATASVVLSRYATLALLTEAVK
jgi:hypothetical protein